MADYHSYPYPSYYWDYQGIDFAYINYTPGLAGQMYADGIRIVGRYLWHSWNPNGKGISSLEALEYQNAGIAVFLYYEVNTGDALAGYQRGVDNGRAAITQCRNLGVQNGTIIYCACDTSVTDAQASGVVLDYLRGFASVLSAGYDGEIFNPHYDPREEIPNPAYNPDDPESPEFIPNPAYDPRETLSQHYTFQAGIYGGQSVVAAAQRAGFPVCQAGAWGQYEYDHINVRQWYLAKNNQAAKDALIRIKNITIKDGLAYWRGNQIDLVSAPNTDHMWRESGYIPPTPDPPPVPPTPPDPEPTPNKRSMPIWFSLRQF